MGRRIFSVKQAILMGMEMNGLIREDNEGMTYLSPNKEYRFEIIRTEAINYFNTTGDFHYMIEMKIFDNTINRLIDIIRFTEIDAIRVLHSIYNYFDDMLEDAADGVTFYSAYFNPSTPRLDNPIFRIAYDDPEKYIQNDGTKALYYTDIENKELREISFSIETYNSVLRQLVPRIRFVMSPTEFNDLLFAIFFGSLIGIDIPNEYQYDMEYITDMIISR